MNGSTANAKIQRQRLHAPSLKALRQRAAELGLTIECDRDDVGWGYWIIGTGWSDETFSADRDELSDAIEEYARQKACEEK
jgi:hypothetical protein